MSDEETSGTPVADAAHGMKVVQSFSSQGRAKKHMVPTPGRLYGLKPLTTFAAAPQRWIFQRVSGSRLISAGFTWKPEACSRYATPSRVAMLSRRLFAKISMYSL